MATTRYFERKQVGPKLSALSRLRTIVETPFYGNNVIEIQSLQQAYDLAIHSPGTIITDMRIEKPEHLGLRPDSRILLFNDGSVTGRAAAARRIVGHENVNTEILDKRVMDAVYDTRWSKLYHAQVVVGLDSEFMVRAHLLIPEGEENLLYDWMLNFQPITPEVEKRLAASKRYAEEGDIYVFSSPQWSHAEHPMGLTYFDPQHNCCALLGMRYFGEHKKGTLTLAWAIANRNGFACCHGGSKKMMLPQGDPYVLAVFGLSGSGKSTITHAKHGGRFATQILHDDAFVIHTEKKFTIALEPTYFDKTQDYPADSPDNKYLLTVQNCGATRDAEGQLICVTEDIRNGNGRAIKSRLWSPNRVDRINERINSIAWIMKDPVLPPLMRVDDPVLASLMGATLSTKRTSAERLSEGIDPSALVIEPYANPFRTYPLGDDFAKFAALFRDGVCCYLLNTGDFLNKKVPKELTLEVIEQCATNKITWKPFAGWNSFYYAELPGFDVPFNEPSYREALARSMQVRYDFLCSRDAYDALPEEAKKAFAHLITLS